MRTMNLLLCLALAGCAGADASHNSAPPPGPAAAAAPASPAAGRAARAAARKNDDEEWWKQGGITREKINAMCWMKYENGRKDLPIDKRADLVNDCVAQALKEHPIR